jgi:hypothetical protein
VVELVPRLHLIRSERCSQTNVDSDQERDPRRSRDQWDNDHQGNSSSKTAVVGFGWLINPQAGGTHDQSGRMQVACCAVQTARRARSDEPICLQTFAQILVEFR